MALVVIDKDCIEVKVRCANWGHVNWTIQMLKKNAETMWGSETSPQEKLQSATILKLIKPDEDER